ncbi:hypothetical protein RSOLAG1IB_01187 [Rhizoctonia solani AG-1 IB]|uniref:Arrestin-like N-terminal domain-containing protein n=1 Tax=Thanatephorus cucumeris (strain AG1-IB / isolate 7/3/14) TaxID=1108050 RepID=A0A0B7FE58_THACB|nr:hypothetical protein RSOLAG1IB_01187 [Rhizoctonia solani AG-1 IB]
MSVLDTSMEDLMEELPGYAPASPTSPREPHEHVNSLCNKNSRPWVTLRLLSDAPVDNKFPVYYDGGIVQGSVRINLESPQTIRSVVVEVEGVLQLPSAYDVSPLWHEKQRLWDSSGIFEPRAIQSNGEWSWDFGFPIPTHFDNTINDGLPRTRLPGNFSLKPYTGYMQYRVLLFVKRGKYISNLVELQTLFAYIPRERAPPPSPLRELAYYQGSTPPDPEADPDGWKECNVINAKGIVFGSREVNMIYRPYLANPTIYPRGGTIFYRIEVSGDDSQALDLLSSPSSIVVLLTREVECKRFKGVPPRGADDRDVDVRAVAQGVPWTLVSLRRENRTRFLEGEIIVPPGTYSSVEVTPVRLNYSVTFVVAAAGFSPHNRSAMVSRNAIRVVSHPAIGVKPVSQLPPGYEQSATPRPTGVDWALSTIGAMLGPSSWLPPMAATSHLD